MIKINLVPGSSSKKSKKKSPKLSLGGGSKLNLGMPKFDGSLGIMGISWLIGFGLLGWMFLGGRHRVSTLTSEIEAAQLDSVRLDAAIKSQADLERRRDVVAQKVTIVQDIDAARYIWAHLADEIARAVPEYTWLAGISPMQADSGVKVPHFSISGRTGNNFALTKYMQQLEQSPFIRQVELKESQLIREDNKVVYSFLLEADYEVPPADILETVPLFAADTPQDSVAAPGAAAPRPGAQPNKPNAAPAQPNKTGKAPAQPNKAGNAPAQPNTRSTPAQRLKQNSAPAPSKNPPKNPPATSTKQSGESEPR